MIEEAFHLERVQFSYGDAPVLKDVNFSIASPGLFGIIGPNGSGKTTLLRLLAATLAPSVGRVVFEGKVLAEMTRGDVARSIAVVPQQDDVVFPFSVRATVLMGRHPHHAGAGFERETDHRIAEEAMQLAGVESLAERAVTTLSGGERHRVMIARALAQTTRTLLLDEPTAHLDIRYQHAVFSLLVWLAHKCGRTVVCVTHDLMLAARYCDRLALLSDGRVHACDTPPVVLTRENISSCYGVDARVTIDASGPHITVESPPFTPPSGMSAWHQGVSSPFPNQRKVW